MVAQGEALGKSASRNSEPHRGDISEPLQTRSLCRTYGASDRKIKRPPKARALGYHYAAATRLTANPTQLVSWRLGFLAVQAISHIYNGEISTFDLQSV